MHTPDPQWACGPTSESPRLLTIGPVWAPNHSFAWFRCFMLWQEYFGLDRQTLDVE